LSSPALLVAVLGAESTGKTLLATGIAQRLAEAGSAGGWRASDIGVVPEALRRFCELQGRTPRVDEQAAIAREQSRRIADALTRHRLVLADTTALMTAVYSEIVFGDTSLYRMARRLHARADLTLLTALDLPWQADGLQRDGAHVREPVDALLRRTLGDAGLAWSVVHGAGPHRVTRAPRAPCLPAAAGGRVMGCWRQPPMTRQRDFAARAGAPPATAATRSAGQAWGSGRQSTIELMRVAAARELQPAPPQTATTMITTARPAFTCTSVRTLASASAPSGKRPASTATRKRLKCTARITA
jgi:nicotinamide riboside kinase